MLYRNMLFKREQLSQIRGLIIQRAWQYLAQRNPFVPAKQGDDLTSHLFHSALTDLQLQPASLPAVERPKAA